MTRRKAAIALVFLALGGCSAGTIEDQYGNQYGSLYNPGQNFRWQLETCEREMDTYSVPLRDRPYAMACCMWLHGVAMDEPPQCR